jgi:hypothetical protein
MCRESFKVGDVTPSNVLITGLQKYRCRHHEIPAILNEPVLRTELVLEKHLTAWLWIVDQPPRLMQGLVDDALTVLVDRVGELVQLEQRVLGMTPLIVQQHRSGNRIHFRHLVHQIVVVEEARDLGLRRHGLKQQDHDKEKKDLRETPHGSTPWAS